jgi:hypothetical protein
MDCDILVADSRYTWDRVACAERVSYVLSVWSNWLCIYMRCEMWAARFEIRSVGFEAWEDYVKEVMSYVSDHIRSKIHAYMVSAMLLMNMLKKMLPFRQIIDRNSQSI